MRREPDVAQRADRALAQLRAPAVDAEDDVLPHARPRQQPRVLEAEGDAALDVDGAGVAGVEPADRAQQRALAAAALADDHEQLAGRDVEVDVAEHDAVAEAALDAAHGDGGDGGDGAHATNSLRHGSVRHSISRTTPSISRPSSA